MPYKTSKGKMKMKDPKAMDTIPSMMGMSKVKAKKGGKVSKKGSAYMGKSKSKSSM
jgi:hypothetical protein